MGLSNLPSVSLSALRAFKTAGRHLSFTKAGLELSVTQAAISHQVTRHWRTVWVWSFSGARRADLCSPTKAGRLMVPVSETFDRLSRALGQFEGGRLKEVLTVGVVGTFAVGWLMERLADFHASAIPPSICVF